MSGAVRNFFVVFLLALLGFGVLGHFVATVAVPALIGGGDESSDSAGEASSGEEISSGDELSGGSPVSGDSPGTDAAGGTFNFAFLCKGADSKLAGIYLLHIDLGREVCVRVLIPGSAAVENNGAVYKLAELYDNRGRGFVLSKLRYLTGCRTDEYAEVCAVDVSGRGRDVTQLSSYLGFTCKLSKGFDYPNPYYGLGGTDPGGEAFDYDSEFIQLKAGSYALGGTTDGVRNDRMLLDTEYNENAFDIYSDLLTHILNDRSLDVTRQEKIFGYMPEKSFRGYAGSGAAGYLFDDSLKVLTCSYSGRFGTWDEIREAVKS